MQQQYLAVLGEDQVNADVRPEYRIALATFALPGERRCAEAATLPRTAARA